MQNISPQSSSLEQLDAASFELDIAADIFEQRTIDAVQQAAELLTALVVRQIEP